MILMIDNYDSFVYNLVRYIEEIGEDVCVYRNDKITIEKVEKMCPQGIIISPGPKSPKDAGLSVDIIKYFKGKIPILGICLGHQAIGYTFGGNIVKGNIPMHGKISEVKHKNEGVFKGIKNPLKVTRYHSLVIDKKSLPKCFNITCESDDGAIMGVMHKEFDIEGVQFHPEAELTECGHKMLQNFIKRCKKC